MLIFHSDIHFSLRGLDILLKAVQVLFFKKLDVCFSTQFIYLTVTYSVCFMISMVSILHGEDEVKCS